MKALLIIAIIFLTLGTIQLLAGSLFKLQHWPGAGLLLVSGTGMNLIGVVCLSVYLIVRVVRNKNL